MEFYTYRMSDVFERFSSGKNITEDKISDSGKYPVYGGNGLRGYTDTSNFKGECILIGRQGAKCGNVRYFNGEGYMTDHAIVGVCKPNHNTQFMNYALASLDLNRLSGQAAQPGLSVGMLKKQKILLPSLENQAKIAKILFRYNNLIENNNRRIALLEKAAQELYKEWFVRFRFPGHETAKFENGLPVGWEIRKIGDIARVKSGYAFKSEWWSDEGVPVIKIKDIQNNTVDFSDLSKVSETHALLARNFFVKEGDLLIAMTGATIGKLAIVPFSDEKLVVNQRVGKFFLGDDSVSTVPFLYCTLQQNWLQELILMVAGSNAAQPNISPFDIEKIKVIYNEKVVAAFNKKASDYISQILLLKKKNQNLAKQRDLLLPRLMSGKLEV